MREEHWALLWARGRGVDAVRATHRWEDLDPIRGEHWARGHEGEAAHARIVLHREVLEVLDPMREEQAMTGTMATLLTKSSTTMPS